LDTSATYHPCLEREWFVSFKKLDGSLVSFGDGHTCHMKGIGTIHIKFQMGWCERVEECEVCTSVEEECDFDRSFGDVSCLKIIKDKSLDTNLPTRRLRFN